MKEVIPDIRKGNCRGKGAEDVLKITDKNRSLINQFIKDIEAEGITKERLSKYKRQLWVLAYVLDKDYDKATREEIKQLGGWINRSEYLPATKRDYRTALRRAFKFWKGDNDIYPIEVRDIKHPKGEQKGRLVIPKKLLKFEDVEHLINLVGNNRDKLYLALSWDTAGRPCELRNLKWKDIEKVGDKTRVIIDTAKKSGDTSYRTILLYHALPYLNRWREEFKEVFNLPEKQLSDKYIFQNFGETKNIPLSHSSLAKMFVYLNEKSKFGRLTPYLFRHSRISWWQNQKINDSVIKKMVGHARNSNIIGEYSHHSTEDIDDAILEAEGVTERKKIEELNPIKTCARCKKENKPKTDNCEFCGFPLSENAFLQEDVKQKEEFEKLKTDFKEDIEKIQKEFDKQKEMTREYFDELLKHPEYLKPNRETRKIMNAVKKNPNKLVIAHNFKKSQTWVLPLNAFLR